MKKVIIIGIGITVVVSAIIVYQQNMSSSSSHLFPEDLYQISPPATVDCHIVNDTLPDPACTPSAIDSRVTQENIDSTICVPGYTETVRPPVSVTEPQKLQSMKEYGFYDSPSNYEFDHLIPLELGGAPDDLKNLWPEPHSSSYEKDAVENYLHEQVCSGNMKLKTAQGLISTNWYDYWLKSRN